MNRIAKFFRDYALARFLLPAGIIAAGVLALAGGVYSIIRVNRKSRAMKKQEEAWKHGN